MCPSGSRAAGIAIILGGSFEIEDDDGLVAGNPSLVSVHGGFGQAGAVRGTNRVWHTSVDLADPTKEPHAGFLFVFGSYLMEWPYGNAFQRTFLGMANYGLGSLWFQAGNPQVLPSIQSLQFEKMALGETIASEYLRTINDNPTLTTANLFISWLGDPTLRWQILAPASNLNGNHGTTVNLTLGCLAGGERILGLPINGRNSRCLGTHHGGPGFRHKLHP